MRACATRAERRSSRNDGARDWEGLQGQRREYCTAKKSRTASAWFWREPKTGAPAWREKHHHHSHQRAQRRLDQRQQRQQQQQQQRGIALHQNAQIETLSHTGRQRVCPARQHHAYTPFGDCANGLRRLAPKTSRLGGDRAPSPRRRLRNLLRQLGVFELLRYILEPGAGIRWGEKRWERGR